MPFDSYQPTSPHSSAEPAGGIRRLFQGLWSLVKTLLIGLGILNLIFLVSLYSLFSMCTRISDRGSSRLDMTPSTSSNMTERNMIEIELDGRIVEAAPPFEELLLDRLMGRPRSTSMDELRKVLRRAAKDERIVGISIRIDETMDVEMPQIHELRALMQTVREAQKKIFVWSSSYDTARYFLASAADQIAIAPVGDASLIGPAFQMVYFGDALRKLGVDVEVVRVGKYKSAFESFIRNDPSAEARDMYMSIEANTREYFVEEIAATRHVDVTTAKQWLKQSMYNASDAVAAGIVNAKAFWSEWSEQVLKSSTEGDQTAPSLIGADEYLDHSQKIEAGHHVGDTSQGLGLIEASGSISFDDSEDRDGAITPRQMAEEVDWAIEDERVKAVVLRIDSPGGSALASDIIWHDLRRLAEKKPLVVSMANVAASGGYYMAVAADHIVAEPTTITGSIGVIGALPSFAAFREKYGVSFHIFTQSDRAQMLNPGTQASGFDKAIIENGIRSTYQTFLERVAAGRDMPVEKVDELAQGRVYNGRQALELGLVDDLGGIHDAYRIAKERAQLDVNKLYPIFRYEGEPISLRQCLKSLGSFYKCVEGVGARSVSRIGTKIKQSFLSSEWPTFSYPEQLKILAEAAKHPSLQHKIMTVSPALESNLSRVSR